MSGGVGGGRSRGLPPIPIRRLRWRCSMEFLIFLGKIEGAIGDAQSALAFLNEDMVGILQEMGEVNYSAAIRALQDAKKSNNPRREIESAITSLRQAFFAFRRAGEKQGIGSWLTHGILGLFDTRSKPHRRACETALLIATIYYALSNDELAKDYCQEATKSFDRYAKERIDSYGSHRVSPHDIGTRPHPDGIAAVEPQRKEFEAVVKRLRRA